MFIGAGKFQLPGILRAREMGIRTVVIDRDPLAPGLAVADVRSETDIIDVPAAVRIAREQQIDGVLTVASDIALPTVAAVAETLGLSGIRPETALDATNKGRMREKFRDHNVASPVFIRVNSLQECRDACRRITLPVVIKPADNAGSRGVSKVTRVREISDAYRHARSFSRTTEVLVEEFMDGKEIAVDAFISKKKLHVLAVSDKIRTPPPYLLDTSVIFPTRHTGTELEQILSLARDAAIGAISLDNCPLHMEIMITKNGPKAVELAARGAGFKVFTDILPRITGVDTLEASINLALGKEADLTIRKNHAAVLHFFKNKPGKLISIDGTANLASIRGLIEYDIYVKPGDRINPLTSGSDRIGHAITVAENRETAMKLMNRVKRTVKFNVSPE